MSLESKESYQLKPSAKPPSNLVQTIERVNLLMDTLGRTPQGLSPGELAAKVNLPKGTTHRLISSLVYFHFIQQDPATRNYRLWLKPVTLGRMLQDQLDLHKQAHQRAQGQVLRESMQTSTIVSYPSAPLLRRTLVGRSESQHPDGAYRLLGWR